MSLINSLPLHSWILTVHFFGRWENGEMERGTPWDSERSVSKCQHTQLWSQAPAKCDEKGEPLSYQSPTGLLYIRLKSLKCKRTYLTTATLFAVICRRCRGNLVTQLCCKERLVWTRAAGATWCQRGAQTTLQRGGLGSWAHALTRPTSWGGLDGEPPPTCRLCQRPPSFSQVPTEVP